MVLARLANTLVSSDSAKVLVKPLPTRLVELVPALPAAVTARRYLVCVGDCSVEVDDDFDTTTLARLLEVF